MRLIFAVISFIVSAGILPAAQKPFSMATLPPTRISSPADLETFRPSVQISAEAATLTHKLPQSGGQGSTLNFEMIKARLARLPKQVLPNGIESLNQQIRQGLNDTLIMARKPAAAVKLVEEFCQLNAEALREVAPARPSMDQIRLRTRNWLAVRGSKPACKSQKLSVALLKMRSDSHTPEEIVKLTDQILNSAKPTRTPSEAH